MERQVASEDFPKNAACGDEPVPVARENEAGGAGALIFGEMTSESGEQFRRDVQRGTPDVHDPAGDV